MHKNQKKKNMIKIRIYKEIKISKFFFIEKDKKVFKKF